MADPTSKVPFHVYVLIGVVATVLALAMIYGHRQLNAPADDQAKVARFVATETFQRAVEERTQRSLAAYDIETRVGDSDALQALIDDTVARKLASYGDSSAFQTAVVSAMPDQPQIDQNAGRLVQLQAKLDRYESQLTNLANKVDDDESAHQVNQLQGQLVELRDLIADLSDDVHCTLALPPQYTSSFLLKEKRTTELRGYDLVITLGRIKKDVIDSVAISAPNADRTQSDTRIVGNVRLGNSLDFESGGQTYEGVFTFRQARIGPDFVGFEVTRTAQIPEECRKAEDMAAL